jgi:hypothetical protein
MMKLGYSASTGKGGQADHMARTKSVSDSAMSDGFIGNIETRRRRALASITPAPRR